jgi:hypothetical protein
MHFVGNNAWFAVLLSIHVIGAIVGIGPSFTFGILGPMAGQVGMPGGLALLEGIERIEKFLLNPVFLGTQWITGVLMIFNRGLNHNFFSGRHVWLLVAIGLYIVILVLGQAVSSPNVRKMIAAAKTGDGETVQKLAGAQQKIGPLFPIMLFAIMILMIWKPGSGCGALLRC